MLGFFRKTKIFCPRFLYLQFPGVSEKTDCYKDKKPGLWVLLLPV